MSLTLEHRIKLLSDNADQDCTCDEQGTCLSCRARQTCNEIGEILDNFEFEFNKEVT